MTFTTSTNAAVGGLDVVCFRFMCLIIIHQCRADGFHRSLTSHWQMFALTFPVWRLDELSWSCKMPSFILTFMIVSVVELQVLWTPVRRSSWFSWVNVAYRSSSMLSTPAGTGCVISWRDRSHRMRGSVVKLTGEGMTKHSGESSREEDWSFIYLFFTFQSDFSAFQSPYTRQCFSTSFWSQYCGCHGWMEKSQGVVKVWDCDL